MKSLYDTKNYEVIINPVNTDDVEFVMGEDGNYDHREGYLVINKDTGIVEHTTMILPQAIYQCQGFNDSIEVLMKADEVATPLSLVDLITEDVVPN